MWKVGYTPPPAWSDKAPEKCAVFPERRVERKSLLNYADIVDGKPARILAEEQKEKHKMNLTIKTPKPLLLAAIMIVTAAFNASALPPGKTGEWKPINSARDAKALPDKANIMMACAGCKTIRPLDKKGIMAWFSTKVQHDCAACGGKLRFTGATPGKSPGSPTTYVHTCSHCGNVSAYVCASH
jgi:hypothetical protein